MASSVPRNRAFERCLAALGLGFVFSLVAAAALSIGVPPGPADVDPLVAAALFVPALWAAAGGWLLLTRRFGRTVLVLLGLALAAAALVGFRASGAGPW